MYENSIAAPQAVAGYQIKKFTPFNPVDKKTTAIVITPSGEHLVVAKGAPQVPHRLFPALSSGRSCYLT